MVVAGCLAAWAQAPAPAGAPAAASSPPASAAQNPAGQAQQLQTAPGGVLHGLVKSGGTALPGVTVTAQNTLTGKRFSTTTDITGAWSVKIPQNGRYVIRTQFAGFAPGSQEAVLNAASHDQTVNFELLLASRAAEQQQQQARQEAQEGPQAQAIRQLAASGAQNLSLVSALAADTENQAGPSNLSGSNGAAGAELPSIAGNSDFGGDSVAISGQSGQVSPLAGIDMDRVRDAIETIRAQGGLAGGDSGGLFGGGLGGGGFGGGFGGGGFGGGGGRGGRGNFRGFNPGQPHGAIFWIGSNSALNAEPFSITGQPQEQPASGTNRFGITFMSAPYLPRLTKPSGKDTLFLTLSGQRSSSPLDEYATVPTDAERAGDFSAPGLPAIYDPATGLQFVASGNPGIPDGTLNVIPPTQFAKSLNGGLSPALALLKYYPEPNLANSSASNGYNYHLLTTAQSNTTQAGVRYMRSLGKNATQPGGGGRGGFGGGGGRRNQNQGLRQSINLNYNWSDAAADNVNMFPQLGGKSSTNSNSVQAGYTVGYRKVTNIFNASWNRSTSQKTNFFTSGTDIATELGILGLGGAPLNSLPINYGLPSVQVGSIAGLSEQQPSFSLSQTISLTETLSWIHQKHNLRFGGDYRRVHRNFLGGSNSTGTFTFSGKFTEDPSKDPTTGSALADFLLGLPQETAIDSPTSKSYLRDNVWDIYAQDDWRARPSLTLNYGLRYEFFAPYTEKYGRLALVDTNAAGGFTDIAEVQSGGPAPSFGGNLPASLVYPFHLALAPRLGVALRLPRQAVLRAGYGMNFTVGQYGAFASTMGLQPMALQPAFVNEQTNEAAQAGEFTLANGFPSVPTAVTPGTYALDPHYRLPYVQAYNLDVQKTLRWGVVLNAGYNGSRGSRLDVKSSPRRSLSSPNTDFDPTTGLPIATFNYEQAAAFSRFNAGTLRVNKRLTGGIALGANYQYSHSIDDSTSSVQNWQDIPAEEGNSSFDVRHKVSGTYLYELPFGKDKSWVTSGAGSHILEGFSVSGTYSIATGTPLTPYYPAAVSDVAQGRAGTLRPNSVPGVSPTAGGGRAKAWFNVAAFQQPQPDSFGNAFGNVSRNSIAGPGTIQNSMSLAKTMQLGDTRSMEFRATASNVFNTVQYSGVDASLTSPTAGQVISAGAMRSFQFTGRFRF
jgi:hypothetical protein